MATNNNKEIKYNIITTPPPVYEKAREKFGIDFEHTIFAYSPNIHVKSGKLRPDLIVHETTHFKQQEAVGGPEKWWEIYFVDAQQRFEWELEAYRIQWQFIKANYKVGQQQQLMNDIGRFLVKMYNLPITEKEARRLVHNPELSTPKVQ